MPKFLSILSGLVVLLASTHAGALEWRPGLEVGGSVVWLGYDEEIEVWDTGSRLDFNMAATLQFEFGPQGSLFTGLRYSGLGNEVDYDERTLPVPGEVVGTFRIHQRYLGLPVGARWDFARTGGPFMFGGVEFAWLLGADLEYDERATSTTPPMEGEEDIADVLESMNVAGFIGAGLALAVVDHEVELALRYSYGFTDPATSEEWFSGWHTQELAITLGFRL